MKLTRPIAPRSKTDADNKMNADLVLTERASSGDDEARRILVTRLFKRVHRTLSYLSNDSEETRDLAQQALIQILLSAGSYKGDGSLEAWADRVSIQTAAKQLQKRARRTKLTHDIWYPPKTEPAADEQASLNECRTRLAHLLCQLPYRLREPLVLRYLHGYSMTEICKLVNAPLDTVRSRLKTAKKKLEKKLNNDPVIQSFVERTTT